MDEERFAGETGLGFDAARMQMYDVVQDPLERCDNLLFSERLFDNRRFLEALRERVTPIPRHKRERNAARAERCDDVIDASSRQIAVDLGGVDGFVGGHLLGLFGALSGAGDFAAGI